MSDPGKTGRRGPAPSGGSLPLLIGGLGLLALGFVGSLVVLGRQSDRPESGDALLAAGDVSAAGGSLAPATRPADTASGRPPVRFEPPRLNFGALQPGESATGSVRVVNIGSEPLKILSSRASCGCTSVDLANTVIEPGGSALLTTRFDASGLGKKQATVRVRFEGYDQLMELTVQAEVSMALRVEPAYIAASRTLSGRLTVGSIDGRPFRILASNDRPPVFEGFDPQVDEPRSSYDVKWDLTSYDASTCLDEDGDPMPAWWVIETDHPESPIFDVVVRHVCTVPRPPTDGRKWVLSQNRIPIGQLEAGEWAEFRVALKWLRGAEPDDTIDSVLSESPEQFDAELLGVEQTGTLIEARVKVTLKEEHRGLVYGKLRVYSTRHSAPLVVIGRVVE